MLLQTPTNTTWWFLGFFISVWNDSTWGCVVFWFTYISLSFWVEMLEACLVDEIHLNVRTRDRWKIRFNKKKRRTRRRGKERGGGEGEGEEENKKHTKYMVLRSLQTEQVLMLVLPALPWALARTSFVQWTFKMREETWQLLYLYES